MLTFTASVISRRSESTSCCFFGGHKGADAAFYGPGQRSHKIAVAHESESYFFHRFFCIVHYGKKQQGGEMHIGLVNRYRLEIEFYGPVLHRDALENLFDDRDTKTQAGVKCPIVFAKNGGNGYRALLNSDEAQKYEHNDNWNVIHGVGKFDFDWQR